MLARQSRRYNVGQAYWLIENNLSDLEECFINLKGADVDPKKINEIKEKIEQYRNALVAINKIKD